MPFQGDFVVVVPFPVVPFPKVSLIPPFDGIRLPWAGMFLPVGLGLPWCKPESAANSLRGKNGWKHLLRRLIRYWEDREDLPPP